MARIEFADGTFTTREAHEVDPHVALPDNIELVDHGAVTTTGLPDNIPQKALGVEFIDAPEPEPHHRARRAAHRDEAPKEEAPKVDAPKPALRAEMDTSSSVPQGRIGLEHAPDRGNPRRPEHATNDDK